MPFGLASAPGIFPELTSVVLYGLGDFAKAYLGNKIFSSSEEEYIQHVQKSFDCLRQHSLKLSKY